jgi:hypothetical protein
LKAPRRRSSKKGKGDTDETSSSAIQPEKTRSLESSKQKQKSSKIVSDVELQVAFQPRLTEPKEDQKDCKENCCY